MKISGFVAEGFQEVRDFFEKSFQDGKEEDAQLCVYLDEKVVVDLCGSKENDSPYNEDSLQLVYSCGKYNAAIGVAAAVEEGWIQYTDKISKYWPQFAIGGKQNIRLTDVLRHESGLPHLDRKLGLPSVQDFQRRRILDNVVGQILEIQHIPSAESIPRKYHNTTYGFLLGELVRRITPDGSTLGDLYRKQIAGPLGADVYMSVPDNQMHRVVDVKAVEISFLPGWVNESLMRVALQEAMGDFRETWSQAADDNPTQFFNQFCNSKYVRQGELLSVCHASARGLAKVACAMANRGVFKGQRILAESTWEKMHSEPKFGYGVMYIGTNICQGGPWVIMNNPQDNFVERWLKKGTEGFYGGTAMGDNCMMWHPEMRIGFGYARTGVRWYSPTFVNSRTFQKLILKCAKEVKNTE